MKLFRLTLLISMDIGNFVRFFRMKGAEVDFKEFNDIF